jgi:diguanylate cyclase (GGDEF)-like protein
LIEVTPVPSTDRCPPESGPIRRDRASLTLLTGVDAGRSFALEAASNVLGRDPFADVRIDHPTVSRQHARLWRTRDGRYFVEDLGSANGTVVSSRRIEQCELRPSDRIHLGPHILLRFELVDETEEGLQRKLFESSTRDALTQVHNRKYLMDRLEAECAHARRHKSALSVVMLDLDEFKKANDTHGHIVGDTILRAFAGAVAGLVRMEDVFARYGGEEFVIVARSSSHDDAARLAERVRAAVEVLEIDTPDGPLKTTVSAGVASFGELPPKEGALELLARADVRLYLAKGAGRNRVCDVG